MKSKISLLVDSGSVAEHGPEDFYAFSMGDTSGFHFSIKPEVVESYNEFSGQLKEGDWLAVGDAYSIPWAGEPWRIRGATTGQHLARIVVKYLTNRSLRPDPVARLRLAIKKINAFNAANCIPPSASKRAGASIILGHVKDKSLHILQCGDAQGFIKTVEGNILYFENKVLPHDDELLKIQDCLAQDPEINKLKGRQKNIEIWKVLAPVTEHQQSHHANQPGGYPLLDGTDAKIFLAGCAKMEMPLDSIDTIVFSSDGLINIQETARPDVLARRVIGNFSQGGLRKILEYTRTTKTMGFSTKSEAIAITVKRIIP